MAIDSKRPSAASRSGIPEWRVLCLMLLVAAGAAADDVAISMTAVTATKEGRDAVFVDKGLEQVRDALVSLKNFDTFRKVKSANTRSSLGSEASVPITDQYTLYCTPRSIDDSGRILTNIRIEMAPKDKDSKPVNVVKLEIRAVPGDPINILGPKVDDATLVVVLAIGKK